MTKMLCTEIYSCDDCPNCKLIGESTPSMENGYYCRHEMFDWPMMILDENAIKSHFKNAIKQGGCNEIYGNIGFILPDWCPLEDKKE